MQRKSFVWVMIASASMGLSIPGLAQSGDYQGVSHPPADTINTTPEGQADGQVTAAKPSAAVLAAPSQQTYQPTSQDPGYSNPSAAGVQGQVGQTLSVRPQGEAMDSMDPDGDIVHPRAARPGELMEGATIRVRLLDRLSSVHSEKGEAFRGQVASDVLQDGKVLIPAGSGIEGKVSSVTSGHFAGHGSLRLKPEAVILPDGTRFQLHAETTGTPGSHTRMGAEGTINPGSRALKNGVEYGAVVGAGAVTGAVVAGPVGALTGGLIGAGLVTTHLMVSHPQATLEPGAVLLFTLTEPMNLTPASN